ncbi:8184_t:CDS:2, partial [Ambispora leptoticha]
DSEIKVGDEFRLVRGKTPASGDYPFQKKKIPLETVQGFYYIPTPIITSNDTEGAGELFNIATNEKQSLVGEQKEPFFSKPAKLTVSGQLHAEALAQGL